MIKQTYKKEGNMQNNTEAGYSKILLLSVLRFSGSQQTFSESLKISASR
jgi:hypothetical protein